MTYRTYVVSYQNMKKKPYGRKEYPSRGQMPHQDIISDAINAKKCVICQVRMYRLRYKNGRLETSNRFLNRKTCSKKCWSIWIRGKNNPNYKGIEPFCHFCFKKLNVYPSKNAKGRFCKNCFDAIRKNTPKMQISYRLGEIEKMGQKVR